MLFVSFEWLLIFFFFLSSGACSSRSTPRPRPPPPQSTVRPNITFQTYACPEAYAKWYCLNGATCFSVKIGESILYNCESVSTSNFLFCFIIGLFQDILIDIISNIFIFFLFSFRCL